MSTRHHVISHVIALAFLWITCCALTVVAFFAILFIGRWPRPIFNSTSACCAGPGAWGSTPTVRSAPTATRPFRLAEVPDFPTRLEVEYPQALSRGLPLVKWWLLALPHSSSSPCSPAA